MSITGHLPNDLNLITITKENFYSFLIKTIKKFESDWLSTGSILAQRGRRIKIVFVGPHRAELKIFGCLSVTD